jgi:lactoylglutathione lyase
LAWISAWRRGSADAARIGRIPAASAPTGRLGASIASTYSILFGSDLQRSIRFYPDVIGLPFRFSNESYAEFATEGAKFAPHHHGHLRELLGREVPSGEVPWPQGEVALFVDDPDTEHERLQGAGVNVPAPSDGQAVGRAHPARERPRRQRGRAHTA